MNLFNLFKRKIFQRGSILVAISFAVLLPVMALAADVGLTTVGEASGFGSTDLLTIIGNIINVFLSLLGVIFLVLLIYAGFIWMTAGGDGKQVDKAKQILINAVIGLVITMASYAIATFVLNMLGVGDEPSGTISSGSLSAEYLSNSLGSGAIRDHYPERNATAIPRNTKLFVTFRDSMDIPSFITDYDTNDTPTDVSDDVTVTAINPDNIKIYVRDSGDTTALTNVKVSFTDDLKTFVFDPDEYLGSATEDVTYAVFLSDSIKNSDGSEVIDTGGYLWYFTTNTTIDVTPPYIVSVTPVDDSTKDRNITVQMTFSEAVDPTSASGIRKADSGFSNIQVTGTSDTAPIAGNYVITNGYKTISFTSSDACGINSCGKTIYCLPGGELISANIQSATPTSATDPTSIIYPYDGIVDTCGNSFDGSNDGKVTPDDDYSWNFTTTNNINLIAPTIAAITPNILGENVALDQSVQMTFDSILDTGSVTADAIHLTNKEINSGSSHELWYVLRSVSLDGTGEEVITPSQAPVKSLVTVKHGTFLASDINNALSYMYGMDATQGILNEYQNCFMPGEGPTEEGGSCGATAALPFCCNGVAQATTCTLF